MKMAHAEAQQKKEFPCILKTRPLCPFYFRKKKKTVCIELKIVTKRCHQSGPPFGLSAWFC